MREKYWSMYTEIIDKKFYYWHYRSRAIFWNNLINGFLCITSFAGIAAWAIWKYLILMWAIIIGASQVISSIRDIFPFTKQISSVSLLLPELNILINEIDYNWEFIENSKFNDEEINKLIYEFNNRLILLEDKYLQNTYFPRNEGCQTKATADREAYFFQHYNINETKILKGKEAKIANAKY